MVIYNINMRSRYVTHVIIDIIAFDVVNNLDKMITKNESNYLKLYFTRPKILPLYPIFIFS